MKYISTPIMRSLIIFCMVIAGFKAGAQCTIPTGLFAGDAAGVTVLSWDAVVDANNYQIEIEDAEGNPEFFEAEFDVFDITFGTSGLGLTPGLSYKFKVRSECSSDDSDYSSYYTFTAGISTGTVENNFTTGSFTLHSNLVSEAIFINFSLQHPDLIQIMLCDINGSMVKVLCSTTYALGIYSETFSVNDFAPGMYLLVVQFGDQSLTEQIVIH